MTHKSLYKVKGKLLNLSSSIFLFLVENETIFEKDYTKREYKAYIFYI